MPIQKERQRKPNPEQNFGRPAGDEKPINERIAQLAYELHQKRGGEHGHDWEDWFGAEEILARKEHPVSEPVKDRKVLPAKVTTPDAMASVRKRKTFC